VSDAEAPGDGFADQRGRTSLAWTRTALGSVVVALLVTRLAWLHDHVTPWFVVPAALGSVVAVTALLRTRSLASTSASVPRRATAVVAGAVVVLGAAAASLVVLR
jgi:hypothetical protein